MCKEKSFHRMKNVDLCDGERIKLNVKTWQQGWAVAVT